MLWKCKHEEIDKAVRNFLTRKGLKVKEVFSLASGLGAKAELKNGAIYNIPANIVLKEINSNK